MLRGNAVRQPGILLCVSRGHRVSASRDQPPSALTEHRVPQRTRRRHESSARRIRTPSAPITGAPDLEVIEVRNPLCHGPHC